MFAVALGSHNIQPVLRLIIVLRKEKEAGPSSDEGKLSPRLSTQHNVLQISPSLPAPFGYSRASSGYCQVTVGSFFALGEEAVYPLDERGTRLQLSGQLRRSRVSRCHAFSEQRGFRVYGCRVPV